MIADFLDAIFDGDLDYRLDDIAQAVKDRKMSMSRRTLREVAVGDTVRFTSTVRPRYLSGLRLEVVKKNTKTVQVKVVEEDKRKAQRFGYGPFLTPIQFVEKV
jgi:ASC-1-like (ASCH) protein